MSPVSSKPVWLRITATLGVIAALATTFLACYGFFIRAEAESLLKDIKVLRVGQSTEAEALHFFDKHKRLCSDRTCQQDFCITSFKVTNHWLQVLRMEPYAEFFVSYAVKNGKVSGIHASLLRSMPIFPTF